MYTCKHFVRSNACAVPCTTDISDTVHLTKQEQSVLILELNDKVLV